MVDLRIVMIGLYVDDLIIVGHDMSDTSEVKDLLSARFAMKDLGPLRYFLGVDIIQTENGIALSQKQYVMDVVRVWYY